MLLFGALLKLGVVVSIGQSLRQNPDAASWDPGVFGRDCGLETELDTRSVLGYSDMAMGYRGSVA